METNGEDGDGTKLPKAKADIVDDPELDALLNDALQDFGKPPQLPKAKSSRNKKGSSGQGLGAGFNDEMNQVWTEEFIKEATAQFEKKMRECLKTQSATTGPGPSVQPTRMPDDMSKIVEAATKSAVGETTDPTGIASQINETLKNFGPIPDNIFGGNAGFGQDDLAKLMSGFSMGTNPDDAEIDEILPFMTNVMQKLLSKDLLYPVLCDIVDRYPDWLADNRPKIPSEDFEKYNKQYEFMKRICEEYASEKDSDSAELKRKRFDRISELMLQVQCTGPPPTELVGEEGSGIPGMDPNAALGLGGECSIV